MTGTRHTDEDQPPEGSEPVAELELLAAARDRVDAERQAVEGKRRAVERFRDQVAELQARPSGATGTGQTAGPRAGAGTLARDRPADDRCRTVRQAFAETVRPHSVADVDDPDAEPLLETVREELTDAVAVALAPTTEPSFSPGLKRAVLSATDTLHAETAVLGDAVEREADRLEAAEETAETVAATLAALPDLRPLGFEALQERHDRLATARERCENLAERRQSFLAANTSRAGEVGISHRQLVPYLYDDLSVEHPVLVTAARLDAACAARQRAVRQQLIRRV
jgi:hypothetical protein